ncbi:MAG: DUF1549 domain-containing protein, partial [Planctomycetaceae bacterium]|nr:DUF1549 domain-containing protein [Planctomycetaceae bacterium]
GDTVGEDAATGFLVAAAALLPGQIGKDEASMRLARQDELDEIIVGTSAAFLGLTIGCARCHEHKFDPIPQADYYALQAYFAGVRYGDRELRGPDYESRRARAEAMQTEIDSVRNVLTELEPPAFTARTLIIDDEDADRTAVLAEKNGHGTNPEGNQRGYRDDPGSSVRMPNLSRSRYTWWTNIAGNDVFTWNPAVAGRFRLWISWGVHGSGVHTRDARYVLDADGDLQTTTDQQEIARADQYYFAGQTEGESEQKPLWSGLLDTGSHDFTPTTRLILRGGETGTGITADVIVLQEEPTAPTTTSTAGTTTTTATATPTTAPPSLRSPVSALRTVEKFVPVSAKFVRFTSRATIDNNRHQPCLDELQVFSAKDPGRNLAAADFGTRPSSSGNLSETGKHQLKHINDGRFGNDFSWISDELGRGWVQLEFPAAETIDRIEWSRDRQGKFADRLPVDYQIEVSLDGRQWTLVSSSQDRLPYGTPNNERATTVRNIRQRGEPGPGNAAGSDSVADLANRLLQLETEQSELRKPQLVFGGQFGDPEATFVMHRGDPEQPEAEIHPHIPVIFGETSLPAG